MKAQHFALGEVPAVLYGEPGTRGYLFLHGQMGRKEEAADFARIACPKGYQVLAIDLPDHGERQARGEALTPWAAAEDIRAALQWAAARWTTCSLRATSIGAYFGLLAMEDPARALLVSPVLDMEALILTMMGWAGVTEEQLQARGEIPTDLGQVLSWRYLCWVRQHPIHSWTCPTHILYGSADTMISRQSVEAYARRRNARLTVAPGAEHWFHTPEQLAVLHAWEADCC